MLPRFLLTGVVGLLLLPAYPNAAEPVAELANEHVLDRFVGVWRNDIFRKGPEAPDGRKLTSDEVVTKSLKGRYLIGREMNPQSNVKFMWFMTYDPQTKNFVSTYFNTQGLVGTEWKGTWDAATSTLTSKSSDAPPTWTSAAVNRFVNKDTVEANAWMKDDKGQLIFESTFAKARQPAESGEKILAAWSGNATPAAELSPELKVLDRLTGTWDVTSLAKQAEWTPDELRQKSKVVRTWVLNRTYLQDLSTIDDGTETMSLFTYDPKRTEYRAWWFSSTGFSNKTTGQWDELGNTMRLKSTLPDGQTSSGSLHFTDADHHEWKILITDATGKVYFDGVWTCTRAKP